MNIHRIVLFPAILLCITAGSALPATRYWDHGGTDVLWSNPTNWTLDTGPVSNDLVTLGDNAPNAPQTVLLDTNVWLDRLTCNATGNREYTLNATNGAFITFVGGFDIYSTGRTTPVTINSDIRIALDNFQVYRVGGVTTLGGNCWGSYLSAYDPGELVLSGSNSFTYIRMFNGGEIVSKHAHALGNDYFKSDNPSGTLSLATSTVIPGKLMSTSAMDLRLKDSGTNDITLTIGSQCQGDRVTVAPNAGSSSGSLTIRLLVASSHDTEWSLRDTTTLIFANPSATASWGTGGDAVGSVSGPGKVRIESGGTVSVSASNDYTGGTVIQSGMVQLNGNNRFSTTGDLSILLNGTLYLLIYTQTLARLSGEGIVRMSYTVGSVTGGAVVVNGALEPGAPVGTLTCTNKGTLILGPACTSVFELDTLAGAGDKVVLKSSNTSLSLDGTLTIVNLGGLQAGDYKLFDLNGGTLSGDFTGLTMPKGFLGAIDKSSGDVVLKVTKVSLPGAVMLVR